MMGDGVKPPRPFQAILAQPRIGCAVYRHSPGDSTMLYSNAGAKFALADCLVCCLLLYVVVSILSVS